MTLYLYAFIVGISAVVLEIWFRHTEYTFWQILPVIVPIQILIGYSVFKVVYNVVQFIDIAIIFPLATITCRTLAGIFVFKESISIATIAALALVLSANILRGFFR